jgi:hypothetical protein
MNFSNRSIARFGIASLLGTLAALAATPADAASACDPSTLKCSTGTGALKGQINKKLPTEIDSGWMEKGVIKVRTRFTIDPVGTDSIVKIDSQGAMVTASWSEKGMIELSPTTPAAAEGKMDVHFKLVPSLEASIYGITIAKDASQLVNLIPGASFNYDSKASAAILPWGFDAFQVPTQAPALDQSTIFALPFSTLGVGTGTAEGTLSIQAATKPTFKFTTKSVKLDGVAVAEKGGTAKMPIGDVDFLDVNAMVAGEVTAVGSLDVRPVVKVDSVAGISTYGLVKFSFSAVSKAYETAPLAMNLDPATIHIPLPNVKVPKASVNLGDVKPGGEASKTVSIDSTGEMDGLITVESSDPQFTVPGGQIKVSSKGKYDLKIGFKPNGGAASATITVRSNDPDSPEQTFKIGANGADLGPAEGEEAARGEPENLDAPPSDSSGCSLAAAGSGAGSSTYGAFIGLGLALTVLARRRRAS